MIRTWIFFLTVYCPALYSLFYNFDVRSMNGSTDDTTMPPLQPLSGPGEARQVQPFCSDPECQLTWTPVPNMGAALTGYNPVIGNSLSGDRPDPGAKQQIFVPTFQKSGGRLDVHENIHFRDDVQCQLNTETKFVKSFQDYQSLKSNSWKLSQGSTQSSSFNIPLFSLIANLGKKSSSSQSTTADSEFETEASFFGEQQAKSSTTRQNAQSLGLMSVPSPSQSFILVSKTLWGNWTRLPRNQHQGGAKKFWRPSYLS